MKNIYLCLTVLLLCFFTANGLNGEDLVEATKKKAAEVRELKIGFGEYILGQKLSDQQKKHAAVHLLPVAESKRWTFKFQDGDVFVVADKKTDLILGIYKEQEKATRQDVKTMVGDLMMHFEEPTVMAHDKMVYWAFDKDGKVSEELFVQAKETGGLDTLVTVKFSSTEPIFREKAKSEKEAEDPKVEEKSADIYVIITSDPLSSLFLAQNKNK